jgi:hypothetical protein
VSGRLRLATGQHAQLDDRGRRGRESAVTTTQSRRSGEFVRIGALLPLVLLELARSCADRAVAARLRSLARRLTAQSAGRAAA